MNSATAWTPLVGAWAEDLFLHGHDLARWITDYVDLEESLAVGSMSQEGLAHAANLWAALGHDSEWRDHKVYRSEPAEWGPSALCATRLLDWPATVVRGLLVAEGALTLLDRLESQVESLRHVAAVLAAEQRLHAHHWQRWVRVLGHDPATTDDFVKVLAAGCGAASDLFGALSTSSFTDDALLGELHVQWVTRVRAAIAAGGVEIPEMPSRSPRKQMEEHAPLAAILDGIRGVRTAHPDWNYEVVE